MPYQSVFGNQNTPTNTPTNTGGYQSVFGSNTTWQNNQPSNPVQQPQVQSNPIQQAETRFNNATSGIGNFFSTIGTQINSFRQQLSESNPIVKQIGDFLNQQGTLPLKGQDLPTEGKFTGNTPQDIANVILQNLPALIPGGEGGAVTAFSKTKAAATAALQAGVQIIAGQSPSEVIKNLPFGLLGGAKLGEEPMVFKPQDLKGEVVSTDLANTPLGKELLKTAFEGEQTNQDIQISHDPGSNLTTPAGLPVKVDLVDHAEIAQDTAQPNEFTSKTGIEPSVIQTVDTKTGAVEYQTIPEGQLAQFHALIDETGSGVAGQEIDGKIWHLTAKTPDQMFEAGAKFTGQADLGKVQDSLIGSIKEMNSPDDYRLNPIADEVGAILKEDGRTQSSPETENIQPESTANKGGQNINPESNQIAQRSNEHLNPNSQERASSLPGQGPETTSSNSRERVNSRSESTNTSNESTNTSSNTSRNGEGLTPNRLALRVNATAISKGIDELKDLPGHETMNMAEQKKMAEDLLRSDPQKAYDIAMGKEDAPKGLRAESVFKAIEKSITTPEQANELAHSPLTSEASALGQRIKALDVKTSDSPVAAIKKIINAREDAIKQKTGETVNQATNSTIKDIQKEITKVTPKKGDWTSFIKSISC